MNVEAGPGRSSWRHTSIWLPRNDQLTHLVGTLCIHFSTSCFWNQNSFVTWLWDVVAGFLGNPTSAQQARAASSFYHFIRRCKEVCDYSDLYKPTIVSVRRSCDIHHSWRCWYKPILMKSGSQGWFRLCTWDFPRSHTCCFCTNFLSIIF